MVHIANYGIHILFQILISSNSQWIPPTQQATPTSGFHKNLKLLMIELKWSTFIKLDTKL